MKHLLSISDLSREEIVGLMDEADRFHEALDGREVKQVPALRGRVVYNLFYENSTRTSASFEAAGKALSANVMKISASSSSVQKGESLRDTGLTLRALGADAIVMRHPNSGAAQHLAEAIAPNGNGPSVINAGDGQHQHPTQALLDAVTARRRLGDLSGAKFLLVGDCLHSRVVRSDVEIFTALGAEVVLVAPPTLLPVGVENWPVTVSYDFDAELATADAVMMLRVQEERMKGGFFPSAREYSELYGLSEERSAKMRDGAIVMHPGPIIRGKEIGFNVADEEKSTILEQVATGVEARMSVLYTLLSTDAND